MTGRGGGFRCPYCPYTDVIWPFILNHIRTAHPDKETP